ncbi:MAG: hypothetical protein LBH48_03720 [Bifidobacteriaceae bacterium]|jgi:hypothetical protein|nr:hypothetical protein [Bifidobacteriaceae bacterium]
MTERYDLTPRRRMPPTDRATAASSSPAGGGAGGGGASGGAGAAGSWFDPGAAFPDARPQAPALVTMPGMSPDSGTMPVGGSTRRAGEWQTAGGSPSPTPPPAVARLYPGSRPIPVVHPSPSQGPSDDAARSRDPNSTAYPGSRALPMPIQPSSGPMTPSPLSLPMTDGPRVAGPRVAGPRTGAHSAIEPDRSGSASPLTSGATVLDPSSHPVSRPILSPAVPPIQAAGPPTPASTVAAGASGWSRAPGLGDTGGQPRTRAQLRRANEANDAAPRPGGTAATHPSRAAARAARAAQAAPRAPGIPGPASSGIGSGPPTASRRALREASRSGVETGLSGGPRTSSEALFGERPKLPEARAPRLPEAQAPTLAEPPSSRLADLPKLDDPPSRTRRVVHPQSGALPQIPGSHAAPGQAPAPGPGGARSSTTGWSPSPGRPVSLSQSAQPAVRQQAQPAPSVPAQRSPGLRARPAPSSPAQQAPSSPARQAPSLPARQAPARQAVTPPPANMPAPRLAPFGSPPARGLTGIGTPMPGLDTETYQPDLGTGGPSDSFDPASVSHPGTGSIRVWTGSLNAIKAPIAHQPEPRPIFGGPAETVAAPAPQPEPIQPLPPLQAVQAVQAEDPPTERFTGYFSPASYPIQAGESSPAEERASTGPARESVLSAPPYEVGQPPAPAAAPAGPLPPYSAPGQIPAQAPAPASPEPPLFDPGLAEEFAGLLGQAPPGGPLEFLGDEADSAPPWETSGWLTDESYAPGFATFASKPAEDASPVEAQPAQVSQPPEPEEMEGEFDGPPPLLPDGRPPWMEGPDAIRNLPAGKPGRWVLQAILWVVAGIAIGAAIWAAAALLGDADLLASSGIVQGELVGDSTGWTHWL